MEHQRRADLMLLLATSFWGISNCLTAICLRDMQPLTLNAFRFLTAFVVLGFVFRKNVFHVLSFVIVYPAAEFQQLRQASVQKGGGAAAPDKGGVEQQLIGQLCVGGEAL